MASSQKTIFLGGIHGVGKSSAARLLSRKLGAAIVTASELIREARHGQRTWDAEKRATAIPENQRLLVRAFRGREWVESIVILDGHFTLRNTSGNLERISIDIFKALSPTLLVVLTGDPGEIASRLHERDGIDYSVELLEEMQRVEAIHAVMVGEALGVEVVMSRVEEIAALKSEIKKVAASDG